MIVCGHLTICSCWLFCFSSYLFVGQCWYITGSTEQLQRVCPSDSFCFAHWPTNLYENISHLSARFCRTKVLIQLILPGVGMIPLTQDLLLLIWPSKQTTINWTYWCKSGNLQLRRYRRKPIFNVDSHVLSKCENALNWQVLESWIIYTEFTESHATYVLHKCLTMLKIPILRFGKSCRSYLGRLDWGPKYLLMCSQYMYLDLYFELFFRAFVENSLGLPPDLKQISFEINNLIQILSLSSSQSQSG